MTIGVSPKVDFAFKRVFGNPEHTAITIHFLNAVLNLPHPIVHVEILNPIQDKDRASDKIIVLDILAIDDVGRRFNIEMQTTLPAELPKRLTYYNCRSYVGQLSEGEPYLELRPAISICVLDRTLFKDAPEYHLSFRLRCDQNGQVFNDDLVFHTIELQKCDRSSDNVESLNPLEGWCYFLNNAEFMELDELSEQLVDLEFREAAGVLEMISKTPEERQIYEARMKVLHDEEARLIAALDEGREEGRAQGRGEGSLAGRIQLFQQLLGEELTPIEDLLQFGIDELSQKFASLEERHRLQG